MKLYFIFDKSADEFSAPFMAKNDLVAERNFSQNMKQVPEELLKDYELHFLCDFDPDSGILSNISQPCSSTKLCSGEDFKSDSIGSPVSKD